MLRIAFWFSAAAIAINDDAAMKIVIKLSDAFDISNDFYDTSSFNYFSNHATKHKICID
jgi:hypothetical protein